MMVLLSTILLKSSMHIEPKVVIFVLFGIGGSIIYTAVAFCNEFFFMSIERVWQLIQAKYKEENDENFHKNRW